MNPYRCTSCIVLGACIVLASCRQNVYKPPARHPGSFSVRVVDENGRPIENAFFIPGTPEYVQAPGGLSPENSSDRKGYAAPRAWGKPILSVIKDGYRPVVLNVDTLSNKAAGGHNQRGHRPGPRYRSKVKVKHSHNLNNDSAFRHTCTCDLSLSLLTVPERAQNFLVLYRRGL